ncbi:28S ribosomal protein S5, mitochondrial [Octopus sinensis]|uniref:Small ribosomal subunit protein uS5m n=1 Tax=Octopus sinensis TaxID=2607531 RepID=A0A6P7T5T6_9MOLL|nr:28S ribosomal protein S5, mitochondrial [Octopus sinensis]
MASAMLCAVRTSFSVLRPLQTCHSPSILPLLQSARYLPILANLTDIRFSSFFKRLPADRLWESVGGVSNAGRKKGRGRGRKRKVDLHIGQILGDGQQQMVWPGLNAPVMKGKKLLNVESLPHNPDRKEQIQKVRDRFQRSRHLKIPALQRGWTGRRMPGMSIGPPDPLDDFTFEGFDTRVLELKTVANMTATLGRKRSYSAFVVTGNKNGLAGFAKGRSASAKDALRKAKNKAALRLQYIERFEDHTLWHNIFCQYYAVKVFAKKRPKGFGLTCHRVLKTICQVIGIENMYAKVDSHSKNTQCMTKAFFDGLLKQETHQELADRMNMHLVEFRNEREYFPNVVASPSDGKILDAPPANIDLDFSQLYYGGKRQLQKKKRSNNNNPLMRRKLWLDYKHRNQYQSRLDRIVLGFEEPGNQQQK